MASHTLSSELYMKKILAGTSAGVLMAGGLLVATASAPAQADPYGPALYTFCDISGVSTSAGQKVVFKLRVSSNSVSGWSPSMTGTIIHRNGGGKAIERERKRGGEGRRGTVGVELGGRGSK